MGLLRQLAKTAFESVLPRQAFVTRGNAPGVTLTFDDGPHPEHTPRVLDALDAAGLTATFFVVGQRVREYPSLIQRMVNTGHEVGNHTWSHSEPSRTSSTQFLDEVRLTDALIQDITGTHCRLMRPPKGELSLGKLWGLLSMKKTVVLWNRDTKDYRVTAPKELAAWCDAYHPECGDIVLLHDNRPFAADAVEPLRRQMQSSRVECCSVAEQIERNNLVLGPGQDVESSPSADGR